MLTDQAEHVRELGEPLLGSWPWTHHNFLLLNHNDEITLFVSSLAPVTVDGADLTSHDGSQTFIARPSNVVEVDVGELPRVSIRLDDPRAPQSS